MVLSPWRTLRRELALRVYMSYSLCFAFAVMCIVSSAITALHQYFGITRAVTLVIQASCRAYFP
jgi:hypothetical protein